jgi:Rps23 Pro-64 3,4-dihydroxylase Tpa1-like proline 4-hydroxylase
MFFEEPFPHYILDNFLEEDYALKLSKEFIDYNHPAWFVYDSPLEVKKACNNWYHFPPTTYEFFQKLNSEYFVGLLSELTGVKLHADHGLHGAGWHVQGNGGRLNVHLDYSLHPKLKLQRKFNFIIYLTPEWKEEWGGNLEFWSHDGSINLPKKKVKTVENKFNRVVLFDASMNSWHGFSKTIKCPIDNYRKSIAMYYLTEPSKDTPERNRALYSPSKEQKANTEILNLIKQRTL